jgi:hypothetical protein
LYNAAVIKLFGSLLTHREMISTFADVQNLINFEAMAIEKITSGLNSIAAIRIIRP